MLMWSQMVHVLCWSEVTSDMQFPFAIHSVTNLMCHVRDTLAKTTRKGKHLGNRNQHSGSRVLQEWLLVLSHWILCLLEGIAVGSSCFCPTVSTAATQNCGIAGFSCHWEFVGQRFPVNCWCSLSDGVLSVPCWWLVSLSVIQCVPVVDVIVWDGSFTEVHVSV